MLICPNALQILLERLNHPDTTCSVCKEATALCKHTCNAHLHDKLQISCLQIHKSGGSHAVHDAEAAQVPVRPAETGIDAAGSASAVLLRDIHCSLLRLIQNQGVEKDKKEAKAQPVTAKLFSPDSGGSVPWTAQLAQLILVAPPTKAAAAAKVCSHTLILVKLTCCHLSFHVNLMQLLDFGLITLHYTNRGEDQPQVQALWMNTSISL